MRIRPLATVIVVSSLYLVACSGDPEDDSRISGEGADLMRGFAGSPVFESPDEILELELGARADRQAFFGDLHVHTTYSFDAFAFGTLATPHDAYRYARGAVIQHPGGFDVQLRQPLDFFAVTDHAMFLGVAAEAGNTSTEFSKLDVARPLNDLNAPDNKGFLSLLPRIRISKS